MESDRQPSVEIRASTCQQCETCRKRERYQIVSVSEDLPHPAILLMSASPLAVMISEVRTPSHSYLFFRCQDPMCLLANTRQSVTEYWLANQRRKMEALQKSVRSKKKRKRRKK